MTFRSGTVVNCYTAGWRNLLKKYPQDVWVQNFWYLPIDKSRLKGEIPKIKSVELMDHFGNFLTQKMYTNNTSNAVIAYTGYLLGYDILADAANSPEIQKLLDSAYKEINNNMRTWCRSGAAGSIC